MEREKMQFDMFFHLENFFSNNKKKLAFQFKKGA